MRRLAFVLGLIVVAAVVPCPLMGQAASPAPTPGSTIVVTGRAERKIPADRASISIAVETRGPTAAAAAFDNARLQKAVLQALRGAGVQDAQLSSAGYSVEPNWREDDRGRPSKRDGYVAENSIYVEVTELDRIGVFIDAALAAGATNVGGVQFTATNTEEARRAVLAAAIINARGDAETMAKAAGGTLGRLIEVSTERFDPSPRMLLQEVRVTGPGGGPTEIAPREIEVSVIVATRWSLVTP